jgi:hypothetical protein
VAVHRSSFLFLLLTSVLLMTGCDCAEEELTSALSPDGELRAAVKVVNCGATSGFATAVTIEGTQGGGDRGTVLQVRHRPLLGVRWDGRRSLVIEDHPCRAQDIPLEVVLEQSRWRDVAVVKVEGTPIDCREPEGKDQKAAR